MNYKFSCLGFIFFVVGCSLTSHADFPAIFNTEPDAERPAMTAKTAALSFRLPDRFRATAFAAEPDVMNPIAMTFDQRGRLWVAENFTYAERSQRFQLELRDRVVIFDNTNGDHFQKRTVFTDDVQMLTGIEVGHGGVWLMCPPNLIFIADRDQDDIPDGPGKVMLDGFTVAQQNYHNFANGLRFGPDGWLYGRCGGSCPGRIGKPETPLEQRPALEGGIWRYHPLRGDVEVLTAGTTNPWGHDWNDCGEMFFCNTVNGHLWHMIPGAHFPRPFTLDPNRRAYEMIDFHADHYHFDTGQSWTQSRDGAANDLGGGHAHCGTLIYQGDRWPQAYQGKLLTLNFHGRRANQERIEQQGSGYVLRHEDDFFISADSWFRGMDLRTGPDGNVFVIDWSDTGECHEHTGVHRESGRIFKISYEPLDDAKTDAERSFSSDLAENVALWSQLQLAATHERANRWHRQQARQVLLERTAAGDDLSDATSRLKKLFQSSGDDPAKSVQTLLTLHGCGAVDDAFLVEQLTHAQPMVRVWAIRLLTERWPIDDVHGPKWKSGNEVSKESISPELLRRFLLLAKNDKSAQVRLALASTLQRLGVSQRAPIAAALVSHAEDADDHNLPLMIWYGLIPLGEQNAASLVQVASVCKIPTTLRLISRCIAEEIERQPSAMEQLLTLVAESDDPLFQQTVLQGISEGLQGWQRAPKPANWGRIVSLNAPTTRTLVRELSVVFGDGRATEQLKQLALGHPIPSDATQSEESQSVSYEIRLSALKTLIQNRHDDLRSVCETLLADARMNVLAAQGLASFDDPDVAKRMIRRYNAFRGTDKPQVISILASRRSFALELLDAIAAGVIPRSDLSAFQVRQIQSLEDPLLNRRIGEVWGRLQETPQEKLDKIASLKQTLTSEQLAQADKRHGRLLFNKHCQNCHRLYGEGGTIGPDLSGANRSNLDYLLGNIVDPSAVVDKDYRMTILLLDDGRVINGLVTDQNDRTVTIHTNTEALTFDQNMIEQQKITDQSPMPEGMLDMLDPKAIQDLVGYLVHPSQVALPDSESPQVEP